MPSTPPAPEQTAQPLDQYVSIGRAAELLDCHQETLRRWAKAGRLPVYRTPGNQRRFKLADISAVMAGQQE